MKIATSLLDLKEPKNQEALKLDKLNIDYFHLDLMDGIFVENKVYSAKEFRYILEDTKLPKDVHLMVSDVKKYIDQFSPLRPEYISFHFEATSDCVSVINYIHRLGIKVGLAINPSTDVSEILDYLDCIDLVLVMSVEPGKGGQKFMNESLTKIDQLYELREKNNYNYLIEVDGGINDETIKLCSKVDICVVGSYITKQDYEMAIENLRK